MTAELQAQAEGFAQELYTTLSGVLTSSVPEFAIEASPTRQGNQTRLLIQPADEAPISLDIDGENASRSSVSTHASGTTAGHTSR